MIEGLAAVIGLAIAGFIIFRVIQGIAAFVKALESEPSKGVDDASGHETNEEVERRSARKKR